MTGFRPDRPTGRDRARRRELQYQGRCAYNAGKAIETNPHENESIEAHWWGEGWLLEWQLKGVGA